MEQSQPAAPQTRPRPGEPSIKVESVSVTYRAAYEKIPTLRTALMRLGRREKLVREIRALRNVSFEVRRGSVLGILGANGAGKSTLMRTIAGILPPTEGRVEVRGRVSTLLALGGWLQPRPERPRERHPRRSRGRSQPR